MGAAYDTFDYPAYWQGRDYEHKSEVVALKALLHKIPKIRTTLEVGAGFGRMIPFYSFRAKKVIVTDPSAKLLALSRAKFKNKKNIIFLQSSLETLPQKIRAKSVDLIIMIRVLHHVTDIEFTFKMLEKLLVDGGYLILEFANKAHFKAILSEVSKGKFDYLKDETTIDIRSPKSIRLKTLPFFNYHPAKIERILAENGFEIVEKRSVSNIRSPLLKSIFATDLLVYIESLLQKPLALINFGPSIFLLTRKRG